MKNSSRPWENQRFHRIQRGGPQAVQTTRALLHVCVNTCNSGYLVRQSQIQLSFSFIHPGCGACARVRSLRSNVVKLHEYKHSDLLGARSAESGMATRGLEIDPRPPKVFEDLSISAFSTDRHLAIEETVREHGRSVQDCGGGPRHVAGLYRVGERRYTGTQRIQPVTGPPSASIAKAPHVDVEVCEKVEVGADPQADRRRHRCVSDGADEVGKVTRNLRRDGAGRYQGW